MVFVAAYAGALPAVIPAQAVMMFVAAYAGALPAVIPAQAVMMFVAAYAGAPPTVIPAKAGIHRCSWHACGGAPNTSIAGVFAVNCAKTAIH